MPLGPDRPFVWKINDCVFRSSISMADALRRHAVCVHLRLLRQFNVLYAPFHGGGRLPSPAIARDVILKIARIVDHFAAEPGDPEGHNGVADDLFFAIDRNDDLLSGQITNAYMAGIYAGLAANESARQWLEANHNSSVAKMVVTKHAGKWSRLKQRRAVWQLHFAATKSIAKANEKTRAHFGFQSTRQVERDRAEWTLNADKVDAAPDI